MDNFISRFQASVKRQSLFTKADRLLLAVSGGMDSVVLAACCQQAGFDFGIAHANFQMRGAESERDEQFVKALADKYQKSIWIRKFDTKDYADQQGVSIQVAARDLRYRWFESLLEKEKFNFILTAHHLDDNIETMLMHFFRGTGIAGLRGMIPKQGKLVRPLLAFPRSELSSFAKAQSLAWVEDSSNESDKYTRNYFRHKLIPDVEAVFPGTLHNLEENLQRFAETEILYAQAIEQHKKKLLKPVGTEMHIPVLLLKKSEPVRSIFYEIIRHYGFSSGQLEDCLKLLDAENGKYVSSHFHRIIRNRAWLIIAPSQQNISEHIIIGSDQSVIDFPEGTLLLKTFQPQGKAEIVKDPAVAMLDEDKIRFPLMLRKWKAGDYFYPLGMKKKKKIARFLIDLKLSKTAKEKVWVLESDQRILWVVGHRIDDRLAVSPAAKKILKIELRMLQLV
ncbi:MAG: tRNA lysidine(34) synthetase TilS [Bacteroidota bacterium]|nr:tRNA lysidine(34) synthetase TilS [Bacteroidota bacterium]